MQFSLLNKTFYSNKQSLNLKEVEINKSFITPWLVVLAIQSQQSKITYLPIFSTSIKENKFKELVSESNHLRFSLDK